MTNVIKDPIVYTFWPFLQPNFKQTTWKTYTYQQNNEQSVIQVNLYTTWFPWFSKICKCERLHLVHCLHVPRSKMSDHPFSWSIINRQKPYSPTDRSFGKVITLVFTHKNRNEIANVSQISILIMFLSMKRFDRKYLYWKVFFWVKWLHY